MCFAMHVCANVHLTIGNGMDCSSGYTEYGSIAASIVLGILSACPMVCLI